MSERCLYCLGEPDHQHKPTHACGHCCSMHGISERLAACDLLDRCRFFNSVGDILISMCAACKKPFDDVHPYDFMNDWTCYEMGYKSAFNDPPGYRRCLKNHTWRQHVAESYSKVGQYLD